MQHDVKDTNVMADINVTPMVDVMLVLLIIFMVVTPALLTGFQATLPQAVNLKERPEDEEATTLGIDRDGNYYLNKKPIRKEDAKQLLTAEFLRHPDDKILFVKTDQKLKYGEVITAMDLARDAGARVLAVVTEAYAKDDKDKH
jgi:biopolymer transport protein ExbD